MFSYLLHFLTVQYCINYCSLLKEYCHNKLFLGRTKSIIFTLILFYVSYMKYYFIILNA